MQFGPESLLPPIIAILLAIATRKIILPLAIGLMIGAALLAWADPQAGLATAPGIFVDRLYRSVIDTSHLQVVAFTLLLGAMVGVMELGGAMRALISHLSRPIRSRRGAQTMIATSGLLIFFDDYANSLLVGGTMRSTADRFGISREKLAYLVDSTAAPVAGLSLVSTWAATELQYMADGLAKAGIDDSTAALTMFVQSIPYRFYACFALVTVFVVAISGRDIGPMRRSEQEADLTESDGTGERPFDSQRVVDGATDHAPWLWTAAVIPIIACVAALLVTLIWTGSLAVGSGFDRSSLTLTRTIEILGNGNPNVALIVGSATGLVLTSLLHWRIGGASGVQLIRDSLHGARQMMPAIFILWFAWALSAMTGDDQLNTGGYLAGVLTDRITPASLPTLVFVVAGFVAFSTGTSWGTMAILTALSIELAFRMTGDVDPNHPIVLTTCGSVLAGAIFGDHCSPISDTTVLSSRASGCNHVAHVRTQMPYAMVAGGVTIVVGTLPAALGVSPWISLAVGAVAIFFIVRLVGTTISSPVK